MRKPFQAKISWGSIALCGRLLVAWHLVGSSVLGLPEILTFGHPFPAFMNDWPLRARNDEKSMRSPGHSLQSFWPVVYQCFHDVLPLSEVLLGSSATALYITSWFPVNQADVSLM